MADSREIVASATPFPGRSSSMTESPECTDRVSRNDDSKYTRTPQEVGETDSPHHASISDGIAAKDTHALGQLYDLVGGRAFGLAYTVTGDAELAEDAVQDAFLALWKQAEKVSKSRGRVESLIMTMVHRRAVDHVRKRARSDRANRALEFEDRSSAGEGDPEQLAIENNEQAEAVKELNRLPREQQNVIELAYFRGLTQREIADETGVSLGTVKGRMRLGLEKLRTAFGLGEERQ